MKVGELCEEYATSAEAEQEIVEEGEELQDESEFQEDEGYADNGHEGKSEDEDHWSQDEIADGEEILLYDNLHNQAIDFFASKNLVLALCIPAIMLTIA